MWEDEFLTWDPEEFGGIYTMMFPPDKIWLPDIAIGNR